MTCARRWEVEAAKDGRLSGDAKASLDRHVEACDVCRNERTRLEGLARALRDIEVPEVNDVGVRRLRQRVLQHADAQLAGRSIPPSASRRLRLLVPAVALVGVIACWFSWRALARPPSLAPAVAKTVVDAKGEADTRWTMKTDGDIETIELSDGVLRLRVSRPPNGRRVIVRVPDGEIEDLGTVFHVVVRDGATQRVGVDEGRVAIRLTDRAPITLGSEQSWERPPATPAAVIGSTSTSPLASSAPLRRTPSSAPVSPPSADEEDTAYLEVLRLVREHRDTEAKTKAREYLRRFPDGFRREEMGRIAKLADPAGQ